ncbi:hypothetical protein B0H14DRAFT_2618489 [Mycena olivaceomarginata]|nr:hypothetical protein B0H14DRAFT_2618489 [Mycena olivaceomarginata]
MVDCLIPEPRSGPGLGAADAHRVQRRVLLRLHQHPLVRPKLRRIRGARQRRTPNTQIVITEFALQNPAGGQGDQLNFFRQAFTFLDSAPFVSMYFTFLASSPSLFWANDPNGAGYVGTGSTLYNDDGSISAVGQLLRDGPGLYRVREYILSFRNT